MFGKLVVASAIGALLSVSAVAQTTDVSESVEVAETASPSAPPTSAGTIQTTTGPQGSVLVVRGGETFFLSPGDALFDGDQIFTRSNGATEMLFGECPVSLIASSSVVVNDEICEAVITSLNTTDVVGGVTIGTGVGEVGATPVIIAGLAAAGGTAAAVAADGDDDGAPASP